MTTTRTARRGELVAQEERVRLDLPLAETEFGRRRDAPTRRERMEEGMPRIPVSVVVRQRLQL
jgi:hypothetical protein